MTTSGERRCARGWAMWINRWLASRRGWSSAHKVQRAPGGIARPSDDITADIVGDAEPSRSLLYPSAARVVYIDNDPVVAAHTRALLARSVPGGVAFVRADVTDPRRIVGHPVLARTLDLGRPVALMLVSVLMYFDDATVADIVSTLMAGLPSGSYLIVSHPTADFTEPYVAARVQKVAQAAGLAYRTRTRAEVETLFTGLELCAPRVVSMLEWAPGPAQAAPRHPVPVHYYVGMGRKP